MAHRQKDFQFVHALIDARLIDPALLGERVASIDLDSVESDQSREILDYRQRESISWTLKAAETRAGKSTQPKAGGQGRLPKGVHGTGQFTSTVHGEPDVRL
ncbi:hypothetical protein GCM10023063_17050 [Arthrobacter methylotrophus]|uniref:Uncharacterized protein n=1 Tax=Arthrobacter methylotrophus TaxID=121291 RepID=A0ABV5URM1_9MICC